MRRSDRVRGAVFVEAVMVVSVMILLFLGLTFFRMLYVNSLITSRLARAGGIAYAMSGCKDILPKTWIAKDAKKYAILPPNASNDTAQTNKPIATQGSNDAKGVTQNMPGMTGGNFLNPIATVSDQGSVSAQTSTQRIGGMKKVFSKTLKPRSFVTCNDVVRDGSFGEVFDYVKSVFADRIKLF
jgi:hypothetical protein